MEFDKSRVFSSVNADELKQGDKVIVADTMSTLTTLVRETTDSMELATLKKVRSDYEMARFETSTGRWCLAYLVERKENCTNCGNGRWDAEHQKILCDPVNCGNGNVVFRNHEIEVCEYWKPKTEKKWCKNCGEICENAGEGEILCPGWKPRTERPELVSLGNGQYAEKPKTEDTCGMCKKAYTDYPCVANVCHDATGRACENFEAEPHYRPFKDTDELIKVWGEKIGATSYWGKGVDLVMPFIWVRYKKEDGSKSKGHLIHGFYEDIIEIQDRTMSMEDLFYFCEFLDGSPCGVEE